MDFEPANPSLEEYIWFVCDACYGSKAKTKQCKKCEGLGGEYRYVPSDFGKYLLEFIESNFKLERR